MKAVIGILIALCALGVIFMFFSIGIFWKKSVELPFEKRAKGLQVRMTVIPVLLVMICILTVVLKQL